MTHTNPDSETDQIIDMYADADISSGRLKKHIFALKHQWQLETVNKVIEIWNVSDSDEVFYGLLAKEFPALTNPDTKEEIE